MPNLRCPRCANVVSVAADESPVCTKCGFGGAAPAPGVPTYAPPVQPYAAPAAGAPFVVAPAAAPATHSPRRAFPIILAVSIGVLLIGGALAGAYFLGAFGSDKGGSVTEAQLKSALAAFREGGPAGTAASGGSDSAYGMVGSMTGMPGFGGGGSGTMSLEFRMLFDGDEDAYEMGYKGSGGGVSVDMTIKQKGRVINYLLGTDAFEGRDEDPATLPAMDEMTEMTGDGASFKDELFGENVVIDGTEGVKHRGKPATKFRIHNPASPEEKGEVIIYDGSQRLAWMKMGVEGGTMEVQMLYGDEVDIQVKSYAQKASFSMGDEPFGGADGSECEVWDSGGFGSRKCTVSEGHVQEVKLNEVELRAREGSMSESGSGQPNYVAAMRLDERSKTVNGFTFTFEDKDQDGLLSAGDTYSYRFPEGDSGSTYRTVEFYDLWAGKPAGGPALGMPGFEGFALLFGLVGLVGVLRFRRGRQL